MAEPFFQLLSALVMLAGAGLVGTELYLVLGLSPVVVARAGRPSTLPEGWPGPLNAQALAGFEGRGRTGQWRWDPVTGRLFFGRRRSVVLGERGWMVGFVDVAGDGAIRWRHTGDSVLVMAWMMAVVGGLGLAVVEGESPGLLMGLFVLPPLALMRWIMVGNASVTLTRAVLPELCEALREHLDGATIDP